MSKSFGSWAGVDLHRAGAEVGVDVLVGDDGDTATGQRKLNGGANQMLVARIAGTHRYRRVAQHGLGPRGGDHDGLRTVAVVDGNEPTIVVVVIHLDGGQRGAAARAPVDDPLGAVDDFPSVPARCASTRFWVAMPAWSIPGNQSAS